MAGKLASGIDLTGIEDQRSAIYRGVMCLIALNGARDFINGQPPSLNDCDDDHIFPKSQYKDEQGVDCIVNRTLISSASNKIKGNKKPSEYLSLFLERHSGDEQRLRQTLRSHLIDKEAYQAMQRDDFQAFLKSRQRAILNEIRRRVRGEAITLLSSDS